MKKDEIDREAESRVKRVTDDLVARFSVCNAGKIWRAIERKLRERRLAEKHGKDLPASGT